MKMMMKNTKKKKEEKKQGLSDGKRSKTVYQYRYHNNNIYRSEQTGWLSWMTLWNVLNVSTVYSSEWSNGRFLKNILLAIFNEFITNHLLLSSSASTYAWNISSVKSRFTKLYPLYYSLYDLPIKYTNSVINFIAARIGMASIYEPIDWLWSIFIVPLGRN